MNSNLAKVGKPTRWPPGKSGNPAGKPPGTRTAFSQGFIRDFALVWAEEGLEAVRKVAKKSPEAFVAIAARICPNDVRLTLEQAIPGGMSLEDYSLMREVIAAIREGLPKADQLQPGAVFQHERDVPFSKRGFQAMVERAAKAAGFEMKIHPHMLRHACGFKLANEGVDTRTIQAYLGHGSIQHTVRYTELAPTRFKSLFRD